MDTMRRLSNLEWDIKIAQKYIDDRQFSAACDTLNVRLECVTCVNDIERLLAVDKIFRLIFDFQRAGHAVTSVGDDDDMIRVVADYRGHKVELTCEPQQLYKFVRFV